VPRTASDRGAIGLPMWNGRLSLDLNRRLRWPAAGLIYRDMLDNSPPAAALWTAIRTLLRTDLQVNPGGTTDADKRAAEDVQVAIDGIEDGIARPLRQMASAALYGFCIHETVFKRLPDGRVGWARWGLRRQDTLYQWAMTKNGAVGGFTQRPPPDYKLRTIWLAPSGRPAGAGIGIHLIADDSDGSPEGRGALRPMYRYWYMVTQFELLAGISLERFGTGMPVFSRVDGVPIADLTEAQTDDLADIARRIRQNEEAYVLEPPGIKFRLEPSPGLDSMSYLNFIQRYSVWMLATALAEFVALGTGESSGSRALGGVKTDLFLKALTGFQDRITEAISRQAVPLLCKYNGWVKGEGGLTDWPRVSLPAVKEYDLGKIGAFLQQIGNVGAFHATPEDEEWLRKIADLHDVDIEELRDLHEEAAQATPVPVQPDGEEDGAVEEEDDEEAEMSMNGREKG